MCIPTTTGKDTLYVGAYRSTTFTLCVRAAVCIVINPLCL